MRGSFAVVFRHCQQDPVAGRCPLSFEVRTVLFEQLALSWIVLQHDVLLPVQSREDHIVKVVATRVQRNDQWTPLLQMMPEVGPLASYCKRPESMLPEVALQVGSINPARPAGVECTLDLFRIGNRRELVSVALPVPHHHRNTGGAAPVFLLLHE